MDCVFVWALLWFASEDHGKERIELSSKKFLWSVHSKAWWKWGILFGCFSNKHHKNRKKLDWEHLIRLLSCKVVFKKICHYYYCHYWYCHYYYCKNLIFFSFVKVWFFKFFTFWGFEFCHNLIFFSFVIIWVVEFDHNLSFWVWSQFELLSLVTICVFEFFTLKFLEFFF